MRNTSSTTSILLSLTLMVLFALASCRQTFSYPEPLKRADSLANVEPETAITLLRGIESSMQSEPLATQMYYRLLCIKAKDKAYVTHTSDTLIMPVLQYYENGGDPALLSTAYYYAGRVYRDLNDVPQALDYFQKGLQAAQQVGEEVSSVLYAQMGEIFFYQSLYDEALGMYREAYKADSVAQDTVGIIFDLRDIAFTLRMQEHYDEALPLLQRAETLAQAIDDEEMVGLVASQLAGLFNRQGDYQQALEHINLALKHVGGLDLQSTYDVYASILLNLGQIAEAEGYFEQLTHADNQSIRLDAYDGLATIAASRNQIGDYTHYFRQYKAVSDSVQRVAATTSVSRMNALYNYQLRERENAQLREQNRQNQVLLVALLAALLLVIVASWTFYRHRRLHMQHKLEQLQRLQAEQYRQSEAFIQSNQREIVKLQNQLKENSPRTTEMTRRLEAQKEHLERSNRLAEVKIEQREQIKKAIQESAVMERLQQNIAQGKHLVPQDITDIEHLLHDICPDFLPALSQLGHLNDLEYQVSLLLKVGISPVAISQLVLREKTSISAVRRRLYKKITGQNGTPSDWDEIILSL
ncbi:MAG: tetratricopeptide repeat protein [Bacteroidaceae bacterium]|nr:tetratricopeptide repeat protein [Bacteroidaceae bacterium]